MYRTYMALGWVFALVISAGKQARGGFSLGGGGRCGGRQVTRAAAPAARGSALALNRPPTVAPTATADDPTVVQKPRRRGCSRSRKQSRGCRASDSRTHRIGPAVSAP